MVVFKLQFIQLILLMISYLVKISDFIFRIISDVALRYHTRASCSNSWWHRTNLPYLRSQMQLFKEVNELGRLS